MRDGWFYLCINVRINYKNRIDDNTHLVRTIMLVVFIENFIKTGYKRKKTKKTYFIKYIYIYEKLI